MTCFALCLPLAAARFDTRNNTRQMRLCDLVVRTPTIPLAPQQPATLHQPQVLGCHVARYLTRLGQLPDPVPPVQQQLDDAQPKRMGQRPQAFGRLMEQLHVQ